MPKRKLGDQTEKSSGSSPCRNYCIVIHSGKDKPFAELLCRDLHARGCPAYFDADSDSLDKSDAAVHATVEVAAAARLAILLLSDEFFMATKWPMLEFSAFVQNNFKQITHLKNVKFILPVYLRMSVTNLVCRNIYWCEGHRPIWNITHWQNWSWRDPRVHLQDWEIAWSMIRSHEAVHVCIPHGSCDWTRHSQRILDDEQGRRLIVERVLTDPQLGFAGSTIQRFAHATANPALQLVHATQPQPQQVREMPGASQHVQVLPRGPQPIRTMPAAAAQEHRDEHDPQLEFAWTTIQRFAHATSNPARQHVHATQPQPQQVREMPGASQYVQVLPRRPQPVHAMLVVAAQERPDKHEQSTPRSAYSHAPHDMELPSAPSAIPHPDGRMHSLVSAAELQLTLSASVTPRPEPSVPALPTSPRSTIPEWLTPPPFNLKGESSMTAECGCDLSNEDHGRDSYDSRDEEHWSDDELEEQNDCDSDEKESGLSENEGSEDIAEDDEDDVHDEDEDDDEDDGDVDDYEEDSSSDGDLSG